LLKKYIILYKYIYGLFHETLNQSMSEAQINYFILYILLI